jgi:hypothetical protein
MVRVSFVLMRSILACNDGIEILGTISLSKFCYVAFKDVYSVMSFKSFNRRSNIPYLNMNYEIIQFHLSGNEVVVPKG